jgi:Phosphoglycerate dehydrogenase and related dehydrogenases
MTKVLKLNSISPLVNDVLAGYDISDKCDKPDIILVRSAAMADYNVSDNLLAVGRAGAGVNNIPHSDYVKKGVVVFNTPGANANAVKELVLLALLMSGRKVQAGIAWAQSLKGSGEDVKPAVEKGKAKFVGCEILGKTLGIVGLGAIGRLVADSAIALGMSVVGYDPYLSADTTLNPLIKMFDTLDELYAVSDFITIHVPFIPATKGFINAEAIGKMKDGVSVINAARGELVVNDDIIEAVKSGKVSRYFTDFPSDDLLGIENVITCPHLGASTPEAEDNCAVMVAEELKDYVENGNIKNSVNFPALSAPRKGARVAVLADGKKSIDKVAAISKEHGATVVTAAKDCSAYALIDFEADDGLADELKTVEGVYRVRVL